MCVCVCARVCCFSLKPASLHDMLKNCIDLSTDLLGSKITLKLEMLKLFRTSNIFFDRCSLLHLLPQTMNVSPSLMLVFTSPVGEIPNFAAHQPRASENLTDYERILWLTPRYFSKKSEWFGRMTSAKVGQSETFFCKKILSGVSLSKQKNNPV